MSGLELAQTQPVMSSTARTATYRGSSSDKLGCARSDGLRVQWIGGDLHTKFNTTHVVAGLIETGTMAWISQAIAEP